MCSLRDNLDDDSKDKLRDSSNKGMTNYCDNLDDDAKDKVRDDDKKRRKAVRDNDKNRRDEIFNDVQTCSMVAPSILETPGFKLIQDEFTSAIQEGPTYVCDICWKFEFRTNVITLTECKYEQNLYDECHTGESEWICKSCHNSLLKRKCLCKHRPII